MLGEAQVEIWPTPCSAIDRSQKYCAVTAIRGI